MNLHFIPGWWRKYQQDFLRVKKKVPLIRDSHCRRSFTGPPQIACGPFPISPVFWEPYPSFTGCIFFFYQKSSTVSFFEAFSLVWKVVFHQWITKRLFSWANHRFGDNGKVGATVKKYHNVWCEPHKVGTANGLEHKTSICAMSISTGCLMTMASEGLASSVAGIHFRF